MAEELWRPIRSEWIESEPEQMCWAISEKADEALEVCDCWWGELQDQFLYALGTQEERLRLFNTVHGEGTHERIFTQDTPPSRREILRDANEPCLVQYGTDEEGEYWQYVRILTFKQFYKLCRLVDCLGQICDSKFGVQSIDVGAEAIWVVLSRISYSRERPDVDDQMMEYVRDYWALRYRALDALKRLRVYYSRPSLNSISGIESTEADQLPRATSNPYLVRNLIAYELHRDPDLDWPDIAEKTEKIYRERYPENPDYPSFDSEAIRKAVSQLCSKDPENYELIHRIRTGRTPNGKKINPDP